MRQRVRGAACIAAAVACAVCAGDARADILEFVITLDGIQEVPPVDTPASGSGTATLDTNTNEFSWEITFSGLLGNETAAHFHGEASHCENAGVVIGLPLGSPKIGSATLTAAQADAVKEGRWYVNIHSDLHPPGEIRGQVMPAPLTDPLDPIGEGTVSVRLREVATGLVSPNWGAHAPGDPDRLFVTDQDGVLWVLDLNTMDLDVFLDVKSLLVPLGVFGPGSFDERGLLGVAFHPGYASNGLFYTYTSEPVNGPADFSTMPAGTTANHMSVIREWTVPDPSDPASRPDPNVSRALLSIDQPQFNHNGGGLAFGPDGMLYISVGDGGGADDFDGRPSLGAPMAGHGCIGNGQDPSNPLGVMMRIDPLGDNSANGRYGVPSDNPFVGTAGFLDENWAYGLRNPWRFAFHPVTGELLVADVGQNDVEEINIVVPGGNYGWNHKEGSFYFVRNGAQTAYITDMPLTPPAGVSGPFIDPIAEYHNPTDGIAIIGGFVYDGDRLPGLSGRYVFGDWSMSFGTPSGRLFYLDAADEMLEFRLVGQDEVGLFVNGFGQDANGEVYVMANSTGTPFGDSGVILRLTCPADWNDDGVVDSDDLFEFLSDWSAGDADYNGDGVTDSDDLFDFLADWAARC